MGGGCNLYNLWLHPTRAVLAATDEIHHSHFSALALTGFNSQSTLRGDPYWLTTTSLTMDSLRLSIKCGAFSNCGISIWVSHYCDKRLSEDLFLSVEPISRNSHWCIEYLVNHVTNPHEASTKLWVVLFPYHPSLTGRPSKKLTLINHYQSCVAMDTPNDWLTASGDVTCGWRGKLFCLGTQRKHFP